MPIRGAIVKNKMSEADRFWSEAKRKGLVENYQEQISFKLSKEEAEKCRYEITDMSMRMAECTVHRENFSHGIRLHPPHLYKIERGIVYFKGPKQWERWYPNFKQNASRLVEEPQ